MSAAQFTPGPWFGPNFNSATAEPTRALTGKFSPKSRRTALSAYDLRIEVSGDNVRADAALIKAAPDLYAALAEIAEGVACDRDHWSAAVARQALTKVTGDA